MIFGIGSALFVALTTGGLFLSVMGVPSLPLVLSTLIAIAPALLMFIGLMCGAYASKISSALDNYDRQGNVTQTSKNKINTGMIVALFMPQRAWFECFVCTFHANDTACFSRIAFLVGYP